MITINDWLCVECGYTNIEKSKDGVLEEPETCYRCETLRVRASKRYRDRMLLQHKVWLENCDKFKLKTTYNEPLNIKDHLP